MLALPRRPAEIDRLKECQSAEQKVPDRPDVDRGVIYTLGDRKDVEFVSGNPVVGFVPS